ncbi:MAG: hypothetical protein ABW032_11505, partial [Burkholderiaceae bacterium]
MKITLPPRRLALLGAFRPAWLPGLGLALLCALAACSTAGIDGTPAAAGGGAGGAGGAGASIAGAI